MGGDRMRFVEFNCLMKRQDNEVLGIEGQEYESKISVDLDWVSAFWEVDHEKTGAKGTGIETRGGATTHLTIDYEEFKKIRSENT